jgi:ADP-ribosylglycohydrolase
VVFFDTNSYQDTGLKVVNLSDDADTAAAVTGVMAGFYYRLGAIPAGWREILARTFAAFRRIWREN